MRRIISTAIGLAALALATTASAAELKDLVGKWKWQEFTVEGSECPATGACWKVIAGPKSIGLEMFRSKPEKRGEFFVGQVVHPATGDVYNTRIRMKDADTWSLDGCTAANVCAQGDFVRVK
jgi:uncharacterized protein (DUF2147 family)